MAARLLLLATVFAGQLLAGWSSETHFEVYEGEWDTCKRINSSMACYQTRDVYCRAVDSGKPAPWRHCSAGGSKIRPETAKECRQCQQDCVVTMWSEWTPCSRDVYTTRHRSVVAPQLQDGKPCPALQERKRCESLAIIADLDRRHTWKLGPWLECEPLDDRDCGEGKRARSVDCVDLQGRTVNQTFCLQEEAYLRVLPPPLAQLCEVPCPCQLSEWSEWSRPTPDCSLSTAGLVSRRSRTVQRHPTLGGQPCGALEEIDINSGEVQCPSVRWETSGWSECTVEDEDTSCGAGFRRRYIYCMEEDMDGVAKQVEPGRCNSTEQPTSLDPCHVPCVQQCRVSEWTAWSHCPNDTCEATLSYRNRTVLVEPYGYDCPHLAEVRECPPIPCAQWVPGEWSSCFPSFDQECGWGTHSRDVKCRDAAGNEIVNGNDCDHLDNLNQVESCYKHCRNDTCVISDWGEWSACSETCGNTQGVQTRSRYVAVNTGSSCHHLEGELSQQQTCTVDTPCEFSVFHIEYSQWGECLVPANATRDGKMCNGVRTRTATCFRDEEEVPDNECVIGSRVVEEPCSVPCSTDCIMSDWSPFSECSSSCLQTRRRRLLEFRDACPSVDSSGFETQTALCDCGSEYHWVAGDGWSSCQAFPTPLSQLSQNYINSLIPDPGALCGQGSQSRVVECGDGDGAVVDERLCDIRTKPPSVRSCPVDCSQRCVITDWTDYSLCNGSATMQQRTRQILPFIGYDEYEDNCPELLSVAQVDEQSCPSHDFSKFIWTIIYDFEELHSCYLPADKVCGPGERYRTIGCINTSVPEADRTAVSPDFCNRQLSDNTVQVCNDNCNTDCEYAHPGWSVWSPCSVTCGTGIQTRTRTVQRNPRGQGRRCGHLNETTTCEMPPCEFFKYSYTDRGVCRPINETMGCGNGVSTSDLVCLVNGVAQPNTSACEPALGLKAPQRFFDCRVPCDGECVWSEWSTLQWCPDCRSGCYKRTRHILRSGDNCEGTTEQFRPCPMDEAFWGTEDWTDCIVQGAPQEYCGPGIQRRKVECRQLNKGGTYDGVCSQLVKPETARGCSVPCPVDCVVDTFSEWSSCGECTSDLRATATRKRRILVSPKIGGRSCPHLMEEKACPNLGCDEFFVETNSSALDCTAEGKDGVCGAVTHDVLLCRNNTQYVELEECLKANASGKIVHNAELLSRHADVYCEIECPAVEECHFTEFGPWSECLHICDWSPEDTFQFRTRTLLASWEGSLGACHRNQQEVRVCPSIVRTTNDTQEEEKCIEFDWVASTWYTNNTRDVKCHSRGWHVEDSACIESLHPVTKRNTELKGVCNCPFLSECNGVTTECFCRGNFEMVGSLCLPTEGCIDNPELMEMSQQCLLHEECSADGDCMCPKDEDCPTQPTTLATPTESVVPTETVTVTTKGVEPDLNGEETSTKPSDILMIALIVSVPLLIFIVILLVATICTCKCRQHLEKKHRRRPPPVILHQNQRLNNQSDASALKPLHDLKGGGVKVQEIAPDTTPHPVHLHNGSASSGFVEELEHYAQTSFNGYSQTQSDIDEATFAAAGNAYAPYPLPDDPPSVPFTPTTPHPPYAPYEIEENDRYHAHGPGGAALQPHPFSRSLSEEAHLAGMMMGGGGGGGVTGGSRMGGGYDSRLDEEGVQFSQDLPEHLTHHGLNYYPPSPASSRAHPHSSHSHHSHHHGNGGGRDNRITAGMDLSMVRAIEQVSASETGSRSPSVSSVGSRSSARRSGRRRHHHRNGHHRGDPRVHSPVGGPSHSAQGYYNGYYLQGDARDPYQSNTLPRSSSKTASPHMTSRSPRHHMTSEASPLVSKVTTPPGRHVRSASNELLEVRRQRHHLRPPLEESHDHQGPVVEMPPALPDEYPLVYHATNPLSTSPHVSTSQASGEGDYDHIRPSAVKPPPLSSVNLKPPPMARLATPTQPNSSSSSPNSPRSPVSPSSSSSGQQHQQFPQELTAAIQKRSNAISSSASSSPQAPPPPPPRTVSTSHQERRGRARNPAARFSPAMLSMYSKENPPAPPTRGPPSLQGQGNPLASDHTGVPPPPPPPPPPVRSS